MSQAEPALRTPWSQSVRDKVFRPVALVVLTAAALVEQFTGKIDAGPLFWPLLVLVLALFTTSLPSWEHWRESAKLALLIPLILASAALFALAPLSVLPVLAFMASAVAGAKLSHARAALLLAGANSVLCLLLSVFLGHTAQGSALNWGVVLFTLSAGLPVYSGLARRNSRQTIYQAQVALRESRRARAAEAREAAASERARIARDVHDVVGHALSGIALQLDMADALAQRGRAEEANAAVRRARELALTGMAETRTAVHSLNEDAQGVAEGAAESAVAERIEHLCTVQSVELTVAGTPWPVSSAGGEALIRGAQESITNARRHAPGAAVRAELEFTRSAVALTVLNTQAPGDASTVKDHHGMGLAGMRQRVTAAHGSLEAGAQPDGGWRVQITVPR